MQHSRSKKMLLDAPVQTLWSCMRKSALANHNPPHEGMRIGRRRRHFCIIQVLLALSIGIEARGQHGIAVLIQKLANQAPGLRGKASLI